MRADAQENRERILDAAAVVFAEQGIAAPMSEVARRAGVGAATLSRRFTSKDELIDAVFERDLGWWLEAVRAAGAADDSWAALVSLLEEACVRQSQNTVCADLMVRAFLHGHRFDAEKAEVRSAVEGIIESARRAGRADPTLGWEDLALLMEAVAGVASVPSARQEARARRLARHFVRSFERAG